MAEVTMPRLSDTMEEGTIARWLKQPGDAVSKGEVLAEIETDKATMELQAYESGTLQEILAPEGATAPIGQAIARIGAVGAGTPAAAPASKGAQDEADPSEPVEGAAEVPPAVGEGGTGPAPSAAEGAALEEAESSVQPSPEAQAAGRPTVVPAPALPEPPGPNGSDRVRASPLARRMAREQGLDLGAIRGSGPEGRVIRADVEAALKGEPEEPATAAQGAAPGPDDESIPLTGMRKTIARRMTESTRTIPHFALTTSVDATELGRLRKQIAEQADAAGTPLKVSVNDFVVRAAALALREVPELNVSFTEDALIKHNRVHIGIAVALDHGLIVPVVRDADTKGVRQLAEEIRELAGRAREGKLQPPEFSGGTFSVSNLGMFGVEQFNAVINPPEAGILAVGAIVREPAEFEGGITLRERMKLTLSIDHRALDGADGARFLQVLKRLIEQPLLLLV